MKRESILLLVCITFLSTVIKTQAYDFETNGIKYTLAGPNIVEVSGASDKSIEIITIPATVENDGKQYTVARIGAAAFMNYVNLKEIVLPETVKSLDQYAFAGCTALTSFKLPEGITEITEAVFSGCSSLQEVTNIDKLETIGWRSFLHCESLGDFFLADTLSDIEGMAFEGCVNINFIIEQNPFFYLRDGIVYDNRNNRLVVYPSSKKDASFTCPAFVTRCGDGAFAGNPYIEEILLPYSVKTIGSHFADECTSLRNVVLPYKLTTIPVNTFCNCESLEKVTLQCNINRLDIFSFMNCLSLSSLTCLAEEPPVCAEPRFPKEIYENCVLYVIPESLELYKADSVWGLFANIMPLEEKDYNVVPERIEIRDCPEMLEVAHRYLLYADVYPIDITTDITINWSASPDIKASFYGNYLIPIEQGKVNVTATIAEYPKVTQTLTATIVGRGENSVEKLTPDSDGFFKVYRLDGSLVMQTLNENEL